MSLVAAHMVALMTSLQSYLYTKNFSGNEAIGYPLSVFCRLLVQSVPVFFEKAPQCHLHLTLAYIFQSSVLLLV